MFNFFKKKKEPVAGEVAVPLNTQIPQTPVQTPVQQNGGIAQAAPVATPEISVTAPAPNPVEPVNAETVPPVNNIVTTEVETNATNPTAAITIEASSAPVTPSPSVNEVNQTVEQASIVSQTPQVEISQEQEPVGETAPATSTSVQQENVVSTPSEEVQTEVTSSEPVFNGEVTTASGEVSAENTTSTPISTPVEQTTPVVPVETTSTQIEAAAPIVPNQEAPVTPAVSEVPVSPENVIPEVSSTEQQSPTPVVPTPAPTPVPDSQPTPEPVVAPTPNLEQQQETQEQNVVVQEQSQEEKKAPQGSDKFCPNCGNMEPIDAIICSNCGSKL